MGRKNNTVLNQRFPLVLENSLSGCRTRLWDQRKRIQIKQKSRRPSLITIGAQHNLVPAEHGLNLSSICFLGTPNKTRLSPLLLCVSPRFSPNGPLYVTPLKRRTWGINTWKQMLMVTCYCPDNIYRNKSLHLTRSLASPLCKRSPKGRACRKRYLRSHYRTIYRGICILHKAGDGARRYTLSTARTSRGNTEPSPGPIRALLEGGPQGRLCRISLP